jgi:predicted membrane channel-forming protein YqfA (hemolysin III family)
MKNRHGKRPFNRKNLSEQNWNINERELNRQWKKKKHKTETRLIFVLKAALILLCALMLYSVLFRTGPADHVVNFAFFGISTLFMITALIFLSGSAAPMSFWGRLNRLRQKRARNDNRFAMKRIVITELWIAYAVFSAVMLRAFVFSERSPFERGCGFVVFMGATFIALFVVILLSNPRSFWGRMQRFLLGRGSPRKLKRC